VRQKPEQVQKEMKWPSEPNPPEEKVGGSKYKQLKGKREREKRGKEINRASHARKDAASIDGHLRKKEKIP